MTDEELVEKYKTFITDNVEGLEYIDITSVNYDPPHAFVVGPKHVEAADAAGGKLTKEIMGRYACMHPQCGLPYAAHTHEQIIVVALTRNMTHDEASAKFESIAEQGIAADGIEGFTFLDKAGFRVKD